MGDVELNPSYDGYSVHTGTKVINWTRKIWVFSFSRSLQLSHRSNNAGRWTEPLYSAYLSNVLSLKKIGWLEQKLLIEQGIQTARQRDGQGFSSIPTPMLVYMLVNIQANMSQELDLNITWCIWRTLPHKHRLMIVATFFIGKKE